MFPDRPVWLRRIDGHAAWGNAALLRTAAITQRTDDPEGGEILRDGDRTPTGVLIDAAMDLVSVPTSSGPPVQVCDIVFEGIGLAAAWQLKPFLLKRNAMAGKSILTHSF